jgi:putative alpha-1,2-mannosidase
VSDENRYVQRVMLNGQEVNQLYLTHEQLMKGGEIIFEMDSKPNFTRGLKAEDKPYSMTEN